MDEILIRPLTARNRHSHWDTAIRLTGDADPAGVLARLARVLIDSATRWGCSVSVSIEPDGDACETGHFVDITAEQGAIWADLTPWPNRFGGAIPHLLDVELELAGWILQRDGVDPDPVNWVNEMPEFMTEDQLVASGLPARRLVAFSDDEDLDSWAARCEHAVNRVLAPRSNRWFLTADASALSGSSLLDHPYNRSGEFYGLWSVDLGRVLKVGEWERAVWPAFSEAANIACANGLHHYHEPPCLRPSGQSGDRSLGGQEGDEDA